MHCRSKLQKTLFRYVQSRFTGHDILLFSFNVPNATHLSNSAIRSLVHFSLHLHSRIAICNDAQVHMSLPAAGFSVCVLLFNFIFTTCTKRSQQKQEPFLSYKIRRTETSTNNVKVVVV